MINFNKTSPDYLFIFPIWDSIGLLVTFRWIFPFILNWGEDTFDSSLMLRSLTWFSLINLESVDLLFLLFFLFLVLLFGFFEGRLLCLLFGDFFTEVCGLSGLALGFFSSFESPSSNDHPKFLNPEVGLFCCISGPILICLLLQWSS